jgi:hypothetical protein
MSLGLGITIYLMLVALVTSIMVYYFRVLRPKDEASYRNNHES